MGASLYDQFHTNVNGVGSLNEGSAALMNQQLVYEAARDNIAQALSGIKATYTGNAADNMSGAFSSLSDSFNDGANLAGSASAAATFQANSFSSAQASITKNVPVPDAPWYEPIDPWNTDHDDAVNKNSQIDSANEAAYNAYGKDTTSNVNFVQAPPPDNSGFGTFAVQNQGSGTSVGTGSGAPSVGGAGGGGGSYSGSRSSLGRAGGSGGGGYSPPTGAGTSGPGGAGTSGSGGSPSGSTSTSGYPGPNPGGSGPGGGNYPGGNYPGSQYPGGGPGGSQGGYPGGQFNGSGPGGMGPMGGYPGGTSGGGGSYGGSSSGGGAGSGGGRGGFGPGGSESAESSSGLGGAGRGGAGAGARSWAGLGGAAEEGEFGGAGAGGAGSRSGAGMGGMGRGGGRGSQDEEHKTAGYLVNEENGNMIIGDFDPVAPPVIGE